MGEDLGWWGEGRNWWGRALARLGEDLSWWGAGLGWWKKNHMKSALKIKLKKCHDK